MIPPSDAWYCSHWSHSLPFLLILTLAKKERWVQLHSTLQHAMLRSEAGIYWLLLACAVWFVSLTYARPKFGKSTRTEVQVYIAVRMISPSSLTPGTPFCSPFQLRTLVVRSWNRIKFDGMTWNRLILHGPSFLPPDIFRGSEGGKILSNEQNPQTPVWVQFSFFFCLQVLLLNWLLLVCSPSLCHVQWKGESKLN